MTGADFNRSRVERGRRSGAGLIRRLATYVRNLLLMPGRVKEVHEMTIETQRLLAARFELQHDLARMTLARVAALHEPARWDGGTVRVVLLVHYPEAWSSLESVFRALDADDRFEVTVASIPRRFPGADRFDGERATHAALTAHGVSHVRLNFADAFESLDVVRALRPHLVFRQSQWDDDVHAAFSSRALSFTRLCLVPYETMNIVENVRHGGAPTDSAVDAPFHRAAWRVFCANEGVRAAVAAGGTLGADRFVVTGHPKAAAIAAAPELWPVGGSDERRGRVVWSAHHSIGERWTRFGMFHRMHEGMLAFAADRRDLDFVFMPHPMLPSFVGHPDSPIDAAEFDAFLGEWDALPNTARYQGPDYAGVLRAGDVVITDGISMLIEGQIVGRPIVYVEREDHQPFNATGHEVIRGVHAFAELDAALAAVDRFAAGAEADPLAELQEHNVRVLFAHRDPEDRIIAAILEGLHAESTARSVDVSPTTGIPEMVVSRESDQVTTSG
jgi:hypothetical protein